MPRKIFMAHPNTVKHRDGTIGAKFPLDRVASLGHLVTVLDSSELALDARGARAAIAKRFETENFDPRQDAFLIAGDATVLCFMVEVAIARYHCAPPYLRWDKRKGKYDLCGGG